MRDRPDAGSLLREVLDQLPAGLRYPVLMVANTMAIAAREVEQGSNARAAERAALRDLFAMQETDDGTELERRLAGEIRAGSHDGAPAVHGLLRSSVRRRLRISNPKALVDDADT